MVLQREKVIDANQFSFSNIVRFKLSCFLSAFGCRREAGVGRRIRQVLDLCARIIEHNDGRFSLNETVTFETPETFSMVFFTMYGHASQYMLSTAKVTVRCSAIAVPEEAANNPSASDVVNFVIASLHPDSATAKRKENRF